MKSENGFHFIEFPAASGKPDALVVILHGHNNHPDMFTMLPAEVQRQHPNADVLIVRAPIPVNATPENKASKGVPNVDDLYTWHKLEKRARPHVNLALAHLFNRIGAVTKLNKFINKQLKKRGLNDKKLAIFGFSMGGAIAVEAATQRRKKCAAVVCHSGLVLPAFKPKTKPDVLLLMGDNDGYFYTQRLTMPVPQQRKGRLKKVFSKAAARIGFHHDDSRKRLSKAKVPFETELIEGMAHTITAESFGKSVAFINKRLSK